MCSMLKKKIVFITLIIFSFKFGSCKKEDNVLFLWNSSQKDVEWKIFGDLYTNPKYKGEIVNGKPNGIGTLIFPDGKKYVGEWVDGKRNGHGILTLVNGKKYVGSWKNDKKHGQGTETFPDGSKNVVEFRNGKKLGKKLLSGITPLSD